MSQTQRQQRLARAEVPLTWELPALGLFACLACVAFSALLGQAAATGLAGGGFPWPSAHVAEAVGGLLHGRLGVGLSPRQRASMPSDARVWAVIAVTEAVALPALWWAILLAASNLSSGSTAASDGLATAAEARRWVGAGALRRHASVVRPDLPRGQLPGRGLRGGIRRARRAIASRIVKGVGRNWSPR